MVDSEYQKEPDGILVTIEGTTALVCLCGRGSFKNSASLKEFGNTALEQHAFTFVINMQRCVGMDSTFMGVLAGLASRSRAKGGKIEMINLSSHTRGLLSTLGLDQLIQTYMTESSPEELQKLFIEDDANLSSLNTQEPNKQKIAETMLQAHETLVDVCPDNLSKFADVLTYLHESVEKAKTKN